MYLWNMLMVLWPQIFMATAWETPARIMSRTAVRTLLRGLTRSGRPSAYVVPSQGEMLGRFWQNASGLT